MLTHCLVSMTFFLESTKRGFEVRIPARRRGTRTADCVIFGKGEYTSGELLRNRERVSRHSPGYSQVPAEGRMDAIHLQHRSVELEVAHFHERSFGTVGPVVTAASRIPLLHRAPRIKLECRGRHPITVLGIRRSSWVSKPPRSLAKNTGSAKCARS